MILGIVGLQILDDSGPSTSVATVTSRTTPTSRPGSSSTTSGLRPAAQVRVKVYNASGVQGRAQILTDQLKSTGYNMQTPANLSRERAGTVVECLKGFDREGALLALYGVPNGAQVQPYPSNPPDGRVGGRLPRDHRHGVATGGGNRRGPAARAATVRRRSRTPARSSPTSTVLSRRSSATPARPRPLPAARAALARLVPVLRTVVVVSGRPAAFLRDALDIDGLGYVGAYGLERIVDGEVVVDDRVRPWVDAIAQRRRRGRRGAARAAGGAQGECGGHHPLAHPARPRGRGGGVGRRGGGASAAGGTAAGTDGGGAAAAGSRRQGHRPSPSLARGASVAAFAGDDAGDLPAFAALHALERDGVLRHGVSIGVASAESPPEVHRADVVVDGPAGLAEVLESLGDALSAPG